MKWKKNRKPSLSLSLNLDLNTKSRGGLLNYRSKEEQLALFDSLASDHPRWVRKEIIGYTVKGKPIPLYRVGNVRGGKFLIDGQIHGCSDLSTEVFYLYLKWLLESGDAVALSILQKRCTLVVPIINIDSYGRKNVNGVDLNRNFTYNWQNAGSTDPKSDYYRGPSPASEPETQAMIGVFKREKPVLYINHHTYGGPYISSFNANATQKAYNDQLAAKYKALAEQMKVDVYPYTSRGLGAGMAASDAAVAGINSFLIELIQYNIGRPPFEEIATYYYPKWLPIGISFSQECPEAPPVSPLAFALPIAALIAISYYLWKKT